MLALRLNTRNCVIRIITLLVSCCITLTATAQSIRLTDNPPSQYVVKKGDTLWDISAKFLKDPWQWKSVWQANRHTIDNPHLIYPGDVVVFQMVNGQPTLNILQETILQNQSKPSGYENRALSPTVIVESLDKTPISTIPLGKISPFLNQPLVVENNALQSAPRIVAGPDDRVILSPGSQVYVRNLPDQAPLDWHVYRQGEPFIDPDTETQLGYEAIYLGNASVTQYGDPASAKITKAREEILVRDRLSPAELAHPIHFMPEAPTHAVKGRIMRIYGGVDEAGPGSIVTINRGEANGIKVGHVLAIQQKGRTIVDKELRMALKEVKPTLVKDTTQQEDEMVTLPDERIGLMMVFRTFKHVAYGLIMQANMPVNTLDNITNP